MSQAQAGLNAGTSIYELMLFHAVAYDPVVLRRTWNYLKG